MQEVPNRSLRPRLSFAVDDFPVSEEFADEIYVLFPWACRVKVIDEYILELSSFCLIDQFIELFSSIDFTCFLISEVRHNLNFVAFGVSVAFFELPDKAEIRLMKC